MKRLALVALTAVLAFTTVGCGSKTEASEGEGGSIKGEITVILNRTDMADTLEEYEQRFIEKYPEVKAVNFETLADYEGNMMVRMNSKDYGDVLLLPNPVKASEYGDFFESLGTLDELENEYEGLTNYSYDNQVYGLPVAVGLNGFVYNKSLFEEAGITELPKTPDELYEVCEKLSKLDGVTPYYTNYAAGWTLTQWEGNINAVAGNSYYKTEDMIEDKEPFSPGKPEYEVYSVLDQLVRRGYVEDDPITSDWELSKKMLADGQIGMMCLGSWALPQIAELAADPNDIGYMPFPYSVNGEIYGLIDPDYGIGVSVNSKNKETAKAFVEFFVEESGYASENGTISVKKGGENSSLVQDYIDSGVVLIQAGLPNRDATKIDIPSELESESEVGLHSPKFKQDIIDAALNPNKGVTFDSIMDGLNEKWSNAYDKVVK